MQVVMMLLYLAVVVVVIAGAWKAFEKAGQPGWAILVPIYNIYIMTVIAKKPAWWLVLFLIPIANIIVAFLIMIEIAKNFGKGTGFGIGLALLGFIFWPMLGFGDAVYQSEETSDMDHLVG